jgi:hypothetical protein
LEKEAENKGNKISWYDELRVFFRELWIAIIEFLSSVIESLEDVFSKKETGEKTKDKEVVEKTKYLSVPSNCRHCGKFLTAKDYAWVDMMKVQCNTCGGVMEVETKEL